MVSNTALWQAINAFDMDAADAAFPFSRRLARDNGWSHSFARATIEDYKRFIYLICVSGTMLTPSDVIDEVWHLHLIYSENYWDRFCGETLHRKIHHGPTKGGEAEAGKYLNAYQRTLTLYVQEFGTPPPPTLWPDEKTRFERPQNIQRIDISDKIILPKRQVFLCLSLGLPLLLAGCEMKWTHNTPHLLLWLGFGLLVLILSLINLKKIRKYGLGLYIFGLCTFAPLIGAFGIPFLYKMLWDFSGHKLGLDVAIAISGVIGTLTWIQVHTHPKPGKRGRYDGSGCGGLSGCGSDGGGHGCGSSGCGSGCGGCGGGD